VTIISDLREAEERAEREWREALRGQNQLDRAEKLLLYLEARGVALKHAANSATA
jgi:hypothetical protein